MLCYAPNLFWSPLLWAISLHCSFCLCPLLGLATWCVMVGVILCDRGNLPMLVLLRGVIFSSLRCLHMLWGPWSPLEWFWGYWEWSRQCHAPICYEHVIQLVLNIHAEFWGNQSCWGGHVVIRIGVWVGCGAEARMLPHCQSTALLCQTPCSKSLLGVYLHMLPHLWCINNLEQGFQHSRWRSNRLMA